MANQTIDSALCNESGRLELRLNEVKYCAAALASDLGWDCCPGPGYVKGLELHEVKYCAAALTSDLGWDCCPGPGYFGPGPST